MIVPSDAYERQLIDAKDYILGAPDHVPAIFGRDREVLLAQGESLLIVGPSGVGKTTFMEQLSLRRAGVVDDDLIGFPVTADTERLTLYLALDRPQQIARSFKRMVTDAHSQKLGNLIVWQGPLPFSMVKEPEMLWSFIERVGEIAGKPVGSVFLDSLKDAAAPLSNDDVGAAVNRAVGGVIARGVEFAATHHQRKATSENRKPTSLADVYGSVWLTAGAGSVLMFWGEPGDPIVEMTHIKQPAHEVGPLELAHDHINGITTRRDRLDAWTVLQAAATAGTTAADVARAMYGANVTRAQIEKARRRLEKFVEDGKAEKVASTQATDSTRYLRMSVNEREAEREQGTLPSRSLTNAAKGPHAPLTLIHDTADNVPHPLKGGGCDKNVIADSDVTLVTDVTQTAATANGDAEPDLDYLEDLATTFEAEVAEGRV